MKKFTINDKQSLNSKFDCENELIIYNISGWEIQLMTRKLLEMQLTTVQFTLKEFYTEIEPIRISINY